MDYIFKEWKEALENYKNKVESDLAEIRKCKQQIQELRTEIFNAIGRGYYRRDEERIILSAPEIIIGDVDKDGNLWMNSKGSKVIIRSNNICLEGVAENVGVDNGELQAEGGSITLKAPSIKQMAVDPGPSGNENVVYPENSSVVMVGKAVKVSTIDNDVLLEKEKEAQDDGVSIHSNKILSLDASVSNKDDDLQAHKDSCDEKAVAANNSITQAGGLKSRIDNDFKRIKGLYKDANKLGGDDVESIRSNAMQLMDYRDQIDMFLPVLYDDVTMYFNALSDLADANREKSACDVQLKNDNDFKKDSTGASIAINGELISLTTIDADGNFRVNKGAGVLCNANNIELTSVDNELKLAAGSRVYVNSENVEVLAAQTTYDEQEKKTKVEPKGNVKIQTKDMEISSYVYDSKTKDDGTKEITRDEYTDGAKLRVSMPFTDFAAIKKDGTSTGTVSLNANEISVVSMDVDPQNVDDASKKKLHADSKMNVLSDKMAFGWVVGNEDIMSSEYAVGSKATSLLGKESVSVAMGADDAVISLKEKKIEIKASEGVEENSKLTVKAPATFEDTVEGKNTAVFDGSVTSKKDMHAADYKPLS